MGYRSAVSPDQTSLWGPGSQGEKLADAANGEDIEYLLVTGSKDVICHGTGTKGLSECRKMLTTIRKCGGKADIFKSLKF